MFEALLRPTHCFRVDTETLAVLNATVSNGSYGGWSLLALPDPPPFPGSPPRLAHSMKMLSMQLFPRAHTTLYMDAKVKLRHPVEEVLGDIANRTSAPIVMMEHPFRSPSANGHRLEFAATIERLKVIESGDALRLDIEDVRRQEQEYWSTFTNQPGMADSCFIVQQRRAKHGPSPKWRQHLAAIHWLECAWFTELRMFSHREQLSLPFVVDALGLRKFVYLLPTVSTSSLLEHWQEEHINQVVAAEETTDYYTISRAKMAAPQPTAKHYLEDSPKSKQKASFVPCSKCAPQGCQTACETNGFSSGVCAHPRSTDISRCCTCNNNRPLPFSRHQVWLAHQPALEVMSALCPALEALFPLTPSYDDQLGTLMRQRRWRPCARDGSDATRFYPTRRQLVVDLYPSPAGESPYTGLRTFDEEEKRKFLNIYPSIAQRNAGEIQSRVLGALGGTPPRLVLEVGSFIGSGAVHVWANLASRTLDVATDGHRFVICADTWQGSLMMRLPPRTHSSIMSSKHGFLNVGELFLRRVLTEGVSDIIYPLAMPSLGAARLLYLLGYRLDVVYLDSAHELGETLIELHMFYSLLRPGGVMLGDDYEFEAVAHDVQTFARCQNATFITFGAHGLQWMVQKPQGPEKSCTGYRLSGSQAI